MASTAISDMTGATQVANADLLPIVSGGVNQQATKQLFLTGAAGESIVLLGCAGGTISVGTGGSVGMQANTGGVAAMGGGGGGVITCNALGSITIFEQTGQGITIGGGSYGISIGPSGLTLGIPAMGNVTINWTAATPGNWGGTGPSSDLVSSVERIAVAVAGLLGGPIP